MCSHGAGRVWFCSMLAWNKVGNFLSMLLMLSLCACGTCRTQWQAAASMHQLAGTCWARATPKPLP